MKRSHKNWERGKQIHSASGLKLAVTKPTVSNIVIGARNEEQLLANIESVGWYLSESRLKMLNEASAQAPIYPHWVGDR